MTALHTYHSSAYVERCQMADATVIVPRLVGDEGMWEVGDIVDVIAADGIEFGGCEVVDFSATHLHVAVS